MMDKRERKIRRALRAVARQRVALILQPGNHWVIERSIDDDDDTDAALVTCYFRGWVEPLEGAIPTARLTPDHRLPPNFRFDTLKTHYRLTSAGWSVIHRSHQLAIVAVLISVISLLIAIANAMHLLGK